MRALSPKTLREVRAVLKDVAAERRTPWMQAARLLESIEAALTPKRTAAPSRKLRAAKRAVAKDALAYVRAVVMARAAGACENCGGAFEALELDHFLGGSGRRRTLQSAWTCWALCHACHKQKTNNAPSAAFWLRHFLRHAGTKSSPAVVAMVQARLESLELQGRAS